MARYRIGNDMTILWSITNKDGSPFPLAGKEVHLYYTCERGRFEADINIQEDNIVVWNFYGSLQKTLGEYSLTLEIFQSEGMRSIKKDVCGAFVFVGKDCEADVKDTTVSLNGEVVAHQEIIKTNLDVCRVSPVIPYVVRDENGIGYWYVDGVNTGDRSTGETAYEYAKSKGYEGTEDQFAEKLAEFPDWNASEGESGYIENKPFCSIVHEYNKIDVETSSYDDEFGTQHTYSFAYEPSDLGPYIWYKDFYGDNFINISDYNDGDTIAIRIYGDVNSMDTEYSFWLEKQENIDSEGYIYNYQYILRTYEDYVPTLIYDYAIKSINDIYIPDTIARTKDVEETTGELREETTALWENLDHGKFPNLVAGDLYGHGESAEAEFSFRASGGKSIKDGTAYVKEVHGNAVVWNQLITGTLRPNGNTTITNDGNVWTITPDGENVYPGIRQENFVVPKGHKYLVAYETLFEGALSVGINMCGQSAEINLTSGGSWISDQRIIDLTTGNNNAIIIFFRNAKSDIKVRNFIVIDLTKMFGAGNEPTTIEDFYKLLPTNIDINVYNEGEVIPFTADGIKSVGDNAWDEEWEQGSIVDNNGNLTSSTSTIRSKNYIKAIGGNEYYFGYFGNAVTWCRVHYYDAEKKWIGSIAKTVNVKSFVPPLNCAYIKFRMGDGYGTTYKNDITISLYHSGWKAEVDNTYKPYWADTLMLDSRIKAAFPNGMYSAGSAYDEIRYNKDTNRWEAVKRIGSIDLGTLDWKSLDAANGMFYLSKANVEAIGMANYYTNDLAPTNLISKKYASTPTYNITEIDKVFRGPFATLYSGYLTLKDTAYTDVTTLKADLQGVMLYYELAEPIVIPLGEFEMDYKVADFGTEEIIGSEPSAPFNGRTIYQFNAVDQIRENYNEIERIKAALAKARITI